jgi:hypothetical protein
VTPGAFANALAAIDLPAVFNPYRDNCPLHDRVDAAEVRRRNLRRCLEAALDVRVDTIWVARDLGYRGGRRTGVALTDEVNLASAAAMMGGIGLERATCGPVVAERTAAVVWRVLSHVRQPVFLWNVFPLHPHDPHDPLSNRCHTRSERDTTWSLLLALVDMVRPKRIVAIGRDAGLALSTLHLPVYVVRHPSYGGQSEFIGGVCALYGVDAVPVSAEQGVLPFAIDQAAICAPI